MSAPHDPNLRDPLIIDIVSDVVCPWCFIGKKRIENAMALRPDIPVELRFRPYFLNDWIPREGISREDYLTRKFGGVDHYKSIAQRVAAAAAEEGLIYAIDKVNRQPNTLDCHRLIHWAQPSGKSAQLKQRLMDLYFTEGGDLSDKNTLIQAAADIGLDRAEIARLLDSETDVDLVTQQAEAAKNAGIGGVPTFIFGNLLATSGAQPADYLAGAIARAAAERDKRNAAE
jgi:predicted DsbA family dithiol-disulfide isomerase